MSRIIHRWFGPPTTAEEHGRTLVREAEAAIERAKAEIMVNLRAWHNRTRYDEHQLSEALDISVTRLERAEERLGEARRIAAEG